MAFLLVVISVLLMTQLCSSSPNIKSQPPNQYLQMNTGDMPNSYSFEYTAPDGSSRSEAGQMLNRGTSDAALDVLGTVRYYDKKGQLYEMTYKAGTRGYRTIIKKVQS